MTPVRSFTLGTAADCDVRVNDDPYVSSRHARVSVDESGSVWVEDLGSTNGTWLQMTASGGGGKVRVYGPRRMLVGDTLWLGGQTAIPWAEGRR